MLSNHGDDRAGENPLVGGLGWVIIIDGAAGRILAINCVTGSPVSAFRHRGVDTAVIETGEGSGLLNDAGERIGEGGVLHAVQDHSAHGHLSGVWLAPGFSRDYFGE